MRAAAAPGGGAAAHRLVAGFTSTSNLEAGRSYDIPTTGTSAHAPTLVHDSERQAFRAQIDSLGQDTTLLVDTYDTGEAVRTGVDVAASGPAAVRIDSGDLPVLAHQVRNQLDELGTEKTHIVATDDLDEHAIARLATAPVDAHGVGTAVVTGNGAPTANLVYKPTARAETPGPYGSLEGIEKYSAGKTPHGARKYPYRRRDATGTTTTELVGVHTPPQTESTNQELLVPLARNGQTVQHEDLDTAQTRHTAARTELPPAALRLSQGEPALDTHYTNHST